MLRFAMQAALRSFAGTAPEGSLAHSKDAVAKASFVLITLHEAHSSADLAAAAAAAGSRSTGQQQLWSLAATSLKCYARFAEVTGNFGDSDAIEMLHYHLQLCTHMVDAFAAALKKLLLRNQQQQPQQLELPVVAVAISSSSSSKGSIDSRFAEVVELQRCWLMLLGRTLLVMSSAVACQEQQQGDLKQPAMQTDEQQQRVRDAALWSVLEAACCASQAVQELPETALGGLLMTVEAQQELHEQAASLVSSCKQELDADDKCLQSGGWLCGTSTQQRIHAAAGASADGSPAAELLLQQPWLLLP
jgi:hypothetical protein